MLKRPRALKFQDQIAVISPSSPASRHFPHRIERATRFLESIGFRVRVYPVQNGDRLSSIRERINHLHAVFSDEDIAGVVCTLGGLSCNELLSFIDFELIGRHPKFFCGYSDITILHAAINKFAGLQTFYGPMAMTQFAEYPEPHEFTIDSFLHASTSEAPIGELVSSDTWIDEILPWGVSDLSRARNRIKNHGRVWITAGKGAGALAGGCLPSILKLVGTKYDIDTTDRIFFLETAEGHRFDLPTPLDVIDSQLTDLRLKGKFDRVKGVLFGRPPAFSESEHSSFVDILKYHFSQATFPVACNLNFGHSDPIVTLPFGASTTMESDSNLIYVGR